MSGRTGLRRARVLLALGDAGCSCSCSHLARVTRLRYAAVCGVVDNLVGQGLAEFDELGLVRLTSSPRVARVHAAAQRLLEIARERGAA